MQSLILRGVGVVVGVGGGAGGDRPHRQGGLNFSLIPIPFTPGTVLSHLYLLFLLPNIMQCCEIFLISPRFCHLGNPVFRSLSSPISWADPYCSPASYRLPTPYTPSLVPLPTSDNSYPLRGCLNCKNKRREVLISTHFSFGIDQDMTPLCNRATNNNGNTWFAVWLSTHTRTAWGWERKKNLINNLRPSAAMESN